MRLYYHEILERASALKTKADKIAFLRAHATTGLKDMLKLTYDERVKFDLPRKPPTFEKCQEHNFATNLLTSTTRILPLVHGTKQHQKDAERREMLYLGLLEAVHPKDADLLVNAVAKKAYPGITLDTVTKAFPKVMNA